MRRASRVYKGRSKSELAELEVGNLRNEVERALGPANLVVPARVGLEVDHGQAVAGRGLNHAPAGILDNVDLAEGRVGGLGGGIRRDELTEQALRVRGRDDLVNQRV